MIGFGKSRALLRIFGLHRRHANKNFSKLVTTKPDLNHNPWSMQKKTDVPFFALNISNKAHASELLHLPARVRISLIEKEHFDEDLTTVNSIMELHDFYYEVPCRVALAA